MVVVRPKDETSAYVLFGLGRRPWTSSTSSGESLLGLLSDWVLAALALLLLSSSAT